MLHLHVMGDHSSLLLVEESCCIVVVEVVVTGAGGYTSRDDSVTTILVGHRIAPVVIKLLMLTVLSLRVCFLKFCRRLDSTRGMTLFTCVDH